MRGTTKEEKAANRAMLIRRYSTAISAHETYAWMGFRDNMRRIAQDGYTPTNDHGLCFETPRLIREYVKHLQQCWPSASGRYSYPVPAPLDWQVRYQDQDEMPPGYSHTEEAARDAFLELPTFEGAYGMYRRRLASFLWAAAEEILGGTGALE